MIKTTHTRTVVGQMVPGIMVNGEVTEEWLATM